MDKKNDKIISLFLKKYLPLIKKIYSPERVIIFGSRVKGENLKSSDLDILIISKKFSKIKYPKRISNVLVNLKINEPMDIICLTPQEFKKKKEEIGIVNIADKEGKVIYEK